MTKQNSGRILLMLAVLLAVLAGGLIAYRWTRPRFVPPVLPVPNGYDDLLRAAEMLAPRTGFYDEMEPEELAAIVEQNQPALVLAREALKKECGVPVDWSRDPAALGVDPALLDQASAMRELCRGFLADTRAALAENRVDEAITSGLDAFRLGNECGRGGLLIDYLAGLGVQYGAVDALRRTAVQVPSAQVQILLSLVPLLQKRESAKEVIQRELGYIRSASRGIAG